MTRTDTLEALLEHEESLRDTLRNEADAAQRQAAEAQAQADGLAAYRVEYMARWSGRFAGPSSIEILRCYRGFVERLDQAIAQQRQMLQRAQAASQAARGKLVAQEQRVAAVERLIERRRADERLAADRREQKVFDEAAQRSATRRDRATPPPSQFATL